MAAQRKFEKRAGVFYVPAGLPEVPDHPTEAREPVYNGIIIRLLKALLKAQGIRVTVFGAENIPLTGGALLAMNHTGYYDFIFGEVAAHLRGKRLVRFMAKKEIFDTPVAGPLMRAMKHVSVDRSSGAASREEAEAHLHDGQLVGIFPEATISRSFELKEFKNGAVRIAADANVPLIPMVTWGSQRIWTKDHPKRLGRTNTPVFIRVGEPVDTGGTPEEAIERLRDAMQDLLDLVREDYQRAYGPFPAGAYWLPAAVGGTAPTLIDAAGIDQQERAARAAKKEKKAAAKLDKRADAALGNARTFIDRVKEKFRR
ncbi:1-acyl-sn-glycerol-3-phosphate acyltransferase [Corynebacterium hylobatis]|uniref:1-acyl-sn-glycerol-3-phosphate acyltransferase n=1 Tax=Corynebacterium hylobatis TaxID=1859290 RepID=A0A3S0AXC6_9CORY|nr:lysophospholipid acyltransferase family protein [Corynebacterium hylobatis]RSZ64729.1 1-acyl-sn-glycerol-3-phosphate acyltransferase [Corynebacterium hylobatis]